MRTLSGQRDIGGAPIATAPQDATLRPPLPAQALLAAETLLVTVAVITTIRLLTTSFRTEVQWLIWPLLLVVAALAPAALRGESLAPVFPQRRRFGRTLSLLLVAVALAMGAAFIGLWLLRAFGLTAPLQATPPQWNRWPGWLLYQLLYVAVAEEVFFRGYVQGNLARLTLPAHRNTGAAITWLVPICGAAAVFALAHVAIHGHLTGLITFAPGVLLGWLFLQTRSLLAPILLHALANVGYCVMASALG